VGKVFRHDFGLPMADSIIPGWLYRKGERGRYSKESGSGKEQPVFDTQQFVEKVGPILARYHEGWYDVVHGWIQRFMIRIAKNFSLTTRIPRIKATHRAKFVAPPDWQQFEPPRFLVMRYALPLQGSSFVLRGWVRKRVMFELNSAALDPPYRFVPLPVVLDLYPLMGNDPKDLFDLQLEFVLTGPRKSKLTVKDLCLLSDTRETVRNEIQVLSQFNMFFSTFTSHGIGVVLGAQTCSSPLSMDYRWCADYPANIHFLKDLLEAYGLRFFNTFSNASQHSILPLGEILKPFVFNDGRLGYDFRRYAYLKQYPNGAFNLDDFSINGQATNYSLADYLGYHIRGAVKTMERFSDGAMIYTHAGVRDRIIMQEERRKGVNVNPLDTFNRNSREALHLLSNRYFNFDGNVPDTARIWVAPTGVILRQARISRNVGESVWYSAERNMVYVRTVFDPILQKPLPDPQNGVLDLCGLTVYVNDSATARVFVDDQEVSHLIRNPVDHTGRESITIADVYSPKVILDDVDLKAKPGRLVERATRYTYNNSLPFHGTGCYEVQLLAPVGSLEWSLPADLPLADQFFLRFAYRKKSADTLIRVGLHLDNRAAFVVEEYGYSDAPQTFRIPRRSEQQWWDVVIPFYHLLSVLKPERRFVPASAGLQRLTFSLKGTPGDTALFDKVEFLREDANVRARDGLFLVCGHVSPARLKEDFIIEMKDGDSIQRVRPARNGYFLFEKKVPKGSIVEVSAFDQKGHRKDPTFGRLVEVWTNVVDVRFD